MTNTQLRIGFLGVGRIGKMHVGLIQNRTADATVTAVFDVYEEASGSVAKEFGTAVAESTHALIESEDVDAVAICTSTDSHIDLLVAAAEAGKPVFIEKPISLDLQELDRGIAAVQKAGIAVQVGFNRRFDAGHRLVRDRVVSGDIGDVHLVRITSRDPAPPPIAYIETSGGIFNDMTIHDFDMARYVTGSEVTEVYATGSVMVDPAIGEVGDLDTAVVILTHENGAITTIDNSRQAVYGYDQRVEAFGSGGMAVSDNPLTTSSVYRNAEGSSASTLPYFFIERYLPSYLAEWSAFVEMVTTDSPSPVTIEDGRAPLIIGLAAAKSVRERRPVPISEIV